jgi:hypothetical protein
MSYDEWPRRWTATITYVDNPLELYASGAGETVEADWSEEDLQRSQAKAAYAEAVQFLLSGVGEAAHVQLWKTTKKHGTVRDHIEYTIDRDAAAAWALKKIVSVQ